MKTALVILFVMHSALALPRHISDHYAGESRNNAVEVLILEQLESVRQIMLDGNSDVPVLDPFQYEDVQLDLNQFGVGGHLNIRDLALKYLSTFEAEEISYGYLTRRLDFRLSVPLLELTGENYDLAVNVNGITAVGNGPATIRIFNGRILGWARIVPSIIGGASLQIQDCHLTLEIGEFESQLEGLLGDGPESAFVNSVLANLVPDLVEHFEDEISGFLNRIFEVAINEVLGNL